MPVNLEFYNSLMELWTTKLSDTGSRIFVRKEDGFENSLHPFLERTLQDLGSFNNIRYAAYRVASKLHLLQNILALDYIELGCIRSVFQNLSKNGIERTKLDLSLLISSVNEVLRLSNATIYLENELLVILSELIGNLIFHIYDYVNSEKVCIFAASTFLVLFSKASLADKYKYFFERFSDHNSYVTKKNLTKFLEIIIQPLIFIGESEHFCGSSIEPAIRNCLEMTCTTSGVSEDQFIHWLLKEPQLVIWISSFHRLLSAKSVRHNERCKTCRAFPIQGLRYRCLVCLRYNLCQTCFFTGRVSGSHVLAHKIQEYSSTSSSVVENTKVLVKTLRNKISKKHRNKQKLHYLPINDENTNPNSQITRFDDFPRKLHFLKSALENPKHASANDYGSMATIDLSHKRVCSCHPLHSSIENNAKFDNDHTVQPSTLQSRPLAGVSSSNQNENRNCKHVINDLEAENRKLLEELRLLKMDKKINGQQSPNMEEEISLLRTEHEGLREKQKVLQTHNLELEGQLNHLRKILSLNDTQSNVVLSADQRTALPMTPELSITMDTTVNSTEMDLNDTYFSIPHVSTGDTPNFKNEEAQLNEAVKAFARHKLPGEDTKPVFSEVFEAADKIGNALSEYVGHRSAWNKT